MIHILERQKQLTLEFTAKKAEADALLAKKITTRADHEQLLAVRDELVAMTVEMRALVAEEQRLTRAGQLFGDVFGRSEERRAWGKHGPC